MSIVFVDRICSELVHLYLFQKNNMLRLVFIFAMAGGVNGNRHYLMAEELDSLLELEAGMLGCVGTLWVLQLPWYRRYLWGS